MPTKKAKHVKRAIAAVGKGRLFGAPHDPGAGSEKAACEAICEKGCPQGCKSGCFDGGKQQ